jgi:hypothetical protein
MVKMSVFGAASLLLAGWKSAAVARRRASSWPEIDYYSLQRLYSLAKEYSLCLFD